MGESFSLGGFYYRMRILKKELFDGSWLTYATEYTKTCTGVGSGR